MDKKRKGYCEIMLGTKCNKGKPVRGRKGKKAKKRERVMIVT